MTLALAEDRWDLKAVLAAVKTKSADVSVTGLQANWKALSVHLAADLVLAAEAFVLARATDQTWEVSVEGTEAAASGGDKDKIISWNIGHFVCGNEEKAMVSTCIR